MAHWRGLGFGAATMVLTHAALAAGWRTWFDPAGTHPAWFLNSGRAVAVTVIALLAASAVLGAWVGRTTRERVAEGTAFALGAVIAMAGILFLGDPGTIVPIVLAFGAAIALASGIGGAVAGGAVRAALSGR